MNEAQPREPPERRADSPYRQAQPGQVQQRQAAGQLGQPEVSPA